MKKIGRGFLWLALIGGLIFGAYLVYSRFWNFDGSTLSKAQKVLADKAQAVSNQAVSSLTVRAADFLKNEAASAITSIGQNLVNFAGNIMVSPVLPNQALIFDSASSSMPFASGTNYVVPPPAAAIIAETNTPLVFAVNLGSAYRVNWGDGKTENGVLSAQTTKLLSHIWFAAGDYTVKLDITEAGIDNYVTFPVRVYAQ